MNIIKCKNDNHVWVKVENSTTSSDTTCEKCAICGVWKITYPTYDPTKNPQIAIYYPTSRDNTR
jgi:hypothetical protein